MLAARPGLLTVAAVTLALVSTVNCSTPRTPEEPSPQQDDAAPPPPDRVGRLSYIVGAVSFQPAGADEWAAAEPNRPVTTGDRLWVDTTGRAEVDVGSAVLRLSTLSELDVLRLDDHWLQVRLPQGTLNERLRTIAGDRDYEIDTPNSAVSLSRAGRYRVDVSPDGGTTTVTVWAGRAEVAAAGSSFPVEMNQVATIRGDTAPTYDLADAGPPDDFDRWALARDDRADRAMAFRYVSEDTPGVVDLDGYGSWADEPGYGPVWYPTVVEADWAPYRVGRWVWVAPWGWTWVDAAPWGYAPFHYGRWAFVRNRWAWCPGRVVVRPVYAPALVVFVGGGGWARRSEFGPGGGVGWFPLAPNEPYYPGYPSDVAYRRRINVTNVTNITNVTNVTNIPYRNRTVGGAVTAVPERAFATGEPIRRAAVVVRPDELQGARVVGATAPVAPTRASVEPTRATGAPPRRLMTRPVVATHAPPPAPVPLTGPPTRPAEPVRSAATPAPDGRTLTPAHVGPPRRAGAVTPPVTPPTPPTATREPSRSKLDASYQAERSQLEARHRKEFAQPSTAESGDAMQRREEAEHRDLDRRYQEAEAKKKSKMPPPKRASEAKAAPRRQQSDR